MPLNNDHAPVRNDERHDGRAPLSDRVRSLRLGEQSAARSSGRSSFLPWAAAFVLLLTTVVFGVKAFRAPPAPAEDATSASNRTTSASTTPTASSGEVSLESKGYIIASHQIQISPQVGGEIIELDKEFREGAFYKKGALLAKVDPVIYEAQLNSARAALAVAETNLQQVQTGSTLKEIEAMEAQVRNLAAKLELAEVEERYNRAAGLGASRSDLEKSMVQIKVDRAALDAQKQTLAKMKASLLEQRLVCRAQVDKAKADIQQAEKQLKNCTIIAPTTGTILSKKAELGGYVNPLAFGAAGYLCEMADLTDLEVDLSIQERDIDKVIDSRDCLVRPEAFANSESFKQKHPDGYRGHISRIMPFADRSKGSISVRVGIDKDQIPQDEAGMYLKPDMSVLVWFKKGK
jgi:HlyD family secretion protein